jgi:4-alpha-glucanotransferase
MVKIKSKQIDRGAGILLPISSLPSPNGIGTLGQEAYNFVDLLAKAKQKYWQVLPIGPTSFGDSPYQSFSAFAGNPYFIDLDILVQENLLIKEDILLKKWGKQDEYVDYEILFHERYELLKEAFSKSNHMNSNEYNNFCQENNFWLKDYSFYMALKFEFQNKEWLLWEEDIRLRKKEACISYERKLKKEIDFWNFCQFKFNEQWKKLKAYTNNKGIKIIGDIPLYVALDSSDVWVHSELFELDEVKNPINVAGVPPDTFSVTGQRWGNPLYNWDVIEMNDFSWWRERMSLNARLYDIIRIDHFIGIVRYYSIPAESPTAMVGKWRKGPGKKLANVISQSIGTAQIIAEDLGVFNPSVKRLIQETGWPGMKILQFAFDGRSENEYLPHNYKGDNMIVYGGTHDNDTTVGFFANKNAKELSYVYDYLGVKKKKDIPDAFVRIGYASVANVVIFQLQDILGLDSVARMNIPATVGMNWRWRMLKGQLMDKDILKLRKLVEVYGR